MNMLIKTLLTLFLLTISVCSQGKTTEKSKQTGEKDNSGLSIRYIANEGVLISSGAKQVLIDGLHREYKPAYAFPPADLLSALETARAPYDKINLLLVSHVHLDHFHPDSIGSHLKNNPKAALISSEQVVGEVARSFADYARIKPQIKQVTPAWKEFVELDHDGVKLKILGLRHSSERFRWIQNLGHIIEIGGKKLLHIGDADMTAENFAAFNLAKEKIDIAFIPYWFLLSGDGRSLVKEQFNAKQVIAVHISPGEAEQVSANLKEVYPEAIPLTNILEERKF